MKLHIIVIIYHIEKGALAMRKQRKTSKSPIYSYALALALVFLLIPLVSTVALVIPGGNGPSAGSKVDNPVSVPKTIKVYRNDTHKVEKIPFEEYVTCVVCSEVPCTFQPEAIKAQSVAARTYALAKIKKYTAKHPASHPKAPICDSTHCQVYRTKSQLLSLHPEGWEKEGFDKIEKAVKETKGQVMYYDGNLVMQPLFFSSSGGYTENSEDVFANAYPYLKSVSSPYESNATHRNEKKSFTLSKLKKALSKAYPQYDFKKASFKNIKILSRTAGGRVDSMAIGDVKLSGTQVRTALGLSSSLFSIEEKDGRLIFSSSGSGHGVGLSQYGANGMAKKGADYKAILKHYYSGVEVQ